MAWTLSSVIITATVDGNGNTIVAPTWSEAQNAVALLKAMGASGIYAAITVVDGNDNRTEWIASIPNP